MCSNLLFIFTILTFYTRIYDFNSDVTGAQCGEICDKVQVRLEKFTHLCFI